MIMAYCICEVRIPFVHKNKNCYLLELTPERSRKEQIDILLYVRKERKTAAETSRPVLWFCSSRSQATSCLHCWNTWRRLLYGLLDDGDPVTARWRLLLDGRESGLGVGSGSASPSSCSASFSFRRVSRNDSFTAPSI